MSCIEAHHSISRVVGQMTIGYTNARVSVLVYGHLEY